MRGRLLSPPLLAVWLAGLASPALAGTFTLFDRTFTRDTGQPQTITFSVRAPATFYRLHLETDRVASAVITLNGAIIVSPDEFNNNVTRIEKPVTLQASNTLSVEVRGKPGGSLRLLIVGEDDEPPVIRPTAMPAANAAGWNNTDVRVTFTCDDAISGIATCPPPISVSAEGANQVITGEAVDVAGNRASASVTLNIDKTPPNIAPSLVPPPNAAGWNRADVTVAFACIDGLSQIALCTPPQVVSSEGAGQVVTGVAIDGAGNQATLVVPVRLDKTAPRISATVDPPPNADGWHRAPSIVRFTCEDSLSGVAACPDPVTVAADGEREVGGTVVDAAGNSSSAGLVVKLDSTAPTITPVFSPPPNAAGWHNTDVTVSFRCEDGGSGVKTCTEPQTITAEGVHALTPVVTDAAGNTFTGSVPVRIDKTPPTIAASPSIPPNQQGWNNTPVTVSFACGDALSELAGCSPPAALDHDGEHRVQGTAVDVAGNSAEAALIVRIDQVAPTIQSALTPQPNARGWNNSDVTVSFTCDDAGSGIHSCAEPELVSQEGSARQVAGVAIDRAGNSARAEAVVNLDKTPPLITATPVPLANAAGWHSTPVTVTFTCSDALSTVETCPAPVSRTSDVVGDIVRGVAVDQAGNSAEARITLNIDRTPPTVKPVSSAQGPWSNQDVQISFNCADAGGSGVASCAETQVVGSEGTHTVSGAVTDTAGNSASSSIEVNIDRTAPTIRAVASPQPGPGGFTNRDITVTFECSDDRSGIATCPSTQVISAEGAHTISGTAIDQAGNSADASASFTIDKTVPAIQAVPTPAPNANGWNNTAVTVAFVCADTASQIATCPPPVELASEGRNQKVSGTATDAAGNTAVIETTLNLDLTAPAIAATATPPPNASGWNNTPVTVSFTCTDALSEISSCAPPQTVGAGVNQAVVGQAVDRAGNVATAGVNVSVDLEPPAVTATLTPPPNQAGWNNADVTISFECADSGSGVAQCPPARVISAEGANQQLTVSTSDRAGHAASLTVAVSLDKTAPQVVIGAPLNGATLKLSPVAVSGTIAESGSGLTALTCNAVAVPSAASFNCERPLSTGANTIIVEAVDAAGNAGTARVDVTYAPNGAPTANAGGPYSGTAGQPVIFDGSASNDPDGDALTFAWNFGDGETATGEKPTHTYASAGTFTVTVLVSDGRGGVQEASVEVSIAAASIGVGVIAGRVYNDTDGLPIDGANVQLLAVSGDPASMPPVSTDALGKFRLATAPGSARILITRDGYTRAERVVQVVDGKRVDPLDARLTPIDAKDNLISSVTGGVAASGDGTLRVEVPAGAMSDDRAIRLTAVGPQGAAASVPLGWSPVLLADVSPREALFQPAAVLTSRAPAGVSPAVTVVVARWDETSGAWIAQGAASRTSDGKELQASIPQAGQYGFLLADSAPDAPPSPVPGQPMEGVSPRAPPGDVQLTITPSPRILFARPEARSRVGILAKSSAPMPSGTPLTIDLAETFNLSGGRRLHRWPGSRTLALHALSGAGLSASFNVKPSRSFPAFALRQGVIDLAGRLPADPFAARGAVIGPGGGQASADTGERVTIPANATSELLPVLLARLSSADVPLTIPSGLSFLGAVFVDLHGGTLARPAALSIPAPAGLASNATVLVAEIVEADELTRVALAAIGRLQGGALVGVTDVLGDGTLQLPGVRREGRYVFLRSDVPLGFLTGIVTGLDGAPLAGAIVESDFPIAALTDADGRYVLAGPVGDVQLRATNLLTKDTTTAAGAIPTANAVSTVSASLGPTPPFVAAVNPPNGAVSVARAGVVSITFSEPIDPSTLAPGSVTLSSGGAAIGGSVSLAPGNSAAVFRPGALLESHTTYQLAVAATIRDVSGNALTAPFMSQFTTVDETPPPRPPAGAITATIPDAAGTFVLAGTQGTADPGGVVLVKNLRTNALTTLTPNADGSFSGTIAATRSDRLELTIQDAAGNKTMVAVPAFRGADGSVVVGSAGGRVEGTGGVAVDVPPGALPDGTVVKAAPVDASAFALPAPTDYPFVGGINLDLGGVVPRAPLDIAVPAPNGAGADDQILVARLTQFPRGPAWTLIDRAHLEDGRYVTASPPFPGVTGQAQYAFFKPQGSCISFVHLIVDFADTLVATAVGDPFATSTTVRSFVVAKSCDLPLRIQVKDPDTDAVIAAIDAHSPAQNGAIADLAEMLTDDDVAPIIIGSNLHPGQQIVSVELRFSESMDKETVEENFHVEDADSNEVSGEVELSSFDTVATFRPTLPFRLGEQYLVKLDGVKDVAGNLLGTGIITFTSFDPGASEPFATFSALPDLGQALLKCAAGACNSSVRDTASIGNILFLANGLASSIERYTFFPPMRVLAVDTTDVSDPVRVGFSGLPANPRAVATVQNATFTPPGGFTFTGDLLLVASGGRILDNVDLSAQLDVYQVTACRTPVGAGNCLADELEPFKGRKLLSTIPGATPLPGVPPEQGVPQQIAVLHQRDPAGDTVAAYVTVSGIGLEAVDVTRAFNVADASPNRAPDGIVRGEFLDVAVLKNQVVTIEHDSPNQQFGISLFSAQLTDKRTLPLTSPAARLAVVENMAIDVDGDGRMGTAENEDEDLPAVPLSATDELFDLAIVGSGPLTEGCGPGVPSPCGDITIVDLSQFTTLNHAADYGGVIARIPTPAPPFSLQVDKDAGLIYVELRGKGLAIVDLSHVRRALAQAGAAENLTNLQDANQDNLDDRLLVIVKKPDIFAGEIKVDFQRGVAHLNGATSGLTTVAVSNRCTELSADFEPRDPEIEPNVDRTGHEDRDKALEREKEILVEILNRAATALLDAGVNGASLLEQGSGACFWREGFPRTCTSFQPGTSDHDIEVFVPQPRVKKAQGVLDAFLDAELEQPDSALAQIGPLTLFAVSRDAFEAAELLNGTPQNRSGDPAGDLAMGRQLLLLLWILEGEYIAGLQDPQSPSLDEILERLKAIPAGPGNPVLPGEPSGIPRLEGYEWALLQELNFYKSGAMLRAAGACTARERALGLSPAVFSDSESNDRTLNFEEADFLHEECDEQIHLVAKGAIRSVMARLAADEETNPLLLEIDRETYRKNGCLTGVHDPRNPPADPIGYTEKPCGSFEEYIASAAVKSVRDGLGPFTAADLPKIFRFYCAKVGEHCADRHGNRIGGALLPTDEEANKFIADAIDFIEQTQTPAVTRQVYEDTVPADTKPIGEIPFLGEIATVCAQHGVPGVDDDSPRKLLRDCNRAIVQRKRDGDPSAQPPSPDVGGPPKPVELVLKKERRKFLARLLGARKYVQRKLRLRIANRGVRTIDETHVRLYEGDGFNQPDYETLTEVPVADFTGAERRILELDADGGPLFPLGFALQGLTPNVPGALAFFLDPDRRVPEADKRDNQASFFYYALDRSAPEGPPNLPAQPVFAIPDVNPDPLCSQRPRFGLQVTASRAQDPPSLATKALTVQVGQEVKLHYQAVNSGHVALKQLVIRRVDKADPVIGPVNLPLPQADPDGVRHVERFLPSGTGTFTVIASATAKDADGNSVDADVARVRITVVPPPCDVMITNLQPDPNPFDPNGLPLSQVMHGGQLFRYYRVVDGRNQPVANANVTLKITQLPGGLPNTLVVQTDADGFIVHDTSDPDVDDSLGLRLGPALFGTQISDFEVHLESVEGFARTCGQTFIARSNRFDFTESLKGGLALDLGGKIVIGLGLEGGAGLDLTLNGHLENGARIFDQLTLGRSLSLKALAQASIEAGQFQPDVGVKILLEGPGLGAKGAETYTVGDRYQFPAGLPLSDAHKLQLFALALETVQAGPIRSFIRRKIGLLADPADALLSSESFGLLISITGTAQLFNGFLGLDQAGGYKRERLGISLAASGSVGLNFGFNAEHRVAARELTFGARMSGQANASLGLDFGLKKATSKPNPPPTNPPPQKLQRQITGIKELLKNQASAEIAEGIGYRWVLDRDDFFLPKRFEVSIDTKKNYGLVLAGTQIVDGGDGGQITRTYSVSGRENIIALFRAATNPAVLLGRLAVADENMDEPVLFPTPARMHEDLVTILDAVLSDVVFAETMTTGNSTNIRLGFRGGALGVSGNLGVSAKFDRAQVRSWQRGVIKDGDEYRLEDYREAQPLPQPFDGWPLIVQDVGSAAEILHSLFHPVQKTPNPAGGGTHKSSGSAELRTRTDADFNAVEELRSYDFELIAGPVQPYAYQPEGVVGVSGKPHYGVGGFHDFMPHEHALTAPATLILDYDESEVTGLDESSLRMYRWNDERRDWDLIGGVLDTDADTATAEITQLGSYTLAPSMPAGQVSWSVENVQVLSPGSENERTRVRFASSVVGTNDGQSPGPTPFHIFSAAPLSFDSGNAVLFGDALTTDLDPALPGVQIVTGADGRIHVEYEYPGRPTEVRLFGFADRGTATSEQVVAIPYLP